MEALGYDLATLATAGLFVVREEGQEPQPRFRHRLIFPIYDVQGRVIAFGGRVIGAGEPKYLNSPESPTFQKSTTLYGLNWARQAIRRDDRVLLVEGYFDCLRLIAWQQPAQSGELLLGIGAILIVIGSLFLTLGMVTVVVDAWRISRVIRMAPITLRSVLEGPDAK